MSPAPSLSAAYAHCRNRAHSHYENFPVASRLLPAPVRDPVAVIYCFARDADDLADEGDALPQQRYAALDRYLEALEASANGQPPPQPVFVALADVLRRHQLPVVLFRDLLSAFRQDVEQRRYRDFTELADYCRRSANPVGRLLLHLTGYAQPLRLQQSDAVCTALQLINFLQDLRQDMEENGRIYLPENEMARFGVSERHLREGISDSAMQALVATQVQRAEALLRQGVPLGLGLPGRFGLEIRLIVAAGLRVVKHLHANHGDVFRRPRLRPMDWLPIAADAFLKRSPATGPVSN